MLFHRVEKNRQSCQLAACSQNVGTDDFLSVLMWHVLTVAHYRCTPIMRQLLHHNRECDQVHGGTLLRLVSVLNVQFNAKLRRLCCEHRGIV